MHDGRVFLLVARGDARVDNTKFKAAFGKGKMLGAEDVEALTGHPVGGVCPFGLATPLPVYLDRSLLDFDEVLPAAGSVNSALRISPTRMAELTGGQWTRTTARYDESEILLGRQFSTRAALVMRFSGLELW
eukprot:gene12117-16318_t